MKSGPLGDVVTGAEDERWENLSQGKKGNCMADSVTDRLAGWLADRQANRQNKESMGSQLYATASRHRCGSEVHQRPG